MRFGEFIKQKRLEKGINLRKLAELVKIAPAYMSDIENGKRNPTIEKLEKFIEVLELSSEEKHLLYDLAANERDNMVAHDISQYVTSNDAVRVALIKAQDLNLGEQEWVEIIRQMERTKNDPK